MDLNNPSDEETRRYNAMNLLKQYIDQNHINSNVILVGDLNDVLTKKEATLQDDPNIDLNTKRKIESEFQKTRKLINEYLQGNDVEGNVLVKMEAAVKAKFGTPPVVE